jgi:hypothetical protein
LGRGFLPCSLASADTVINKNLILLKYGKMLQTQAKQNTQLFNVTSYNAITVSGMFEAGLYTEREREREWCSDVFLSAKVLPWHFF